MKTNKEYLRNKLAMFSLCACMGMMISCGGNQKNVEQEGKSEAEASLPAPATDLHTAVVTGNMKAIEGHIAAGSDLDVQEATVGSSPLITAAVFNKVEIARALVEAGADVNYQNREGSAALHTAAFLCRKEIVELLLAKGADKSLKNVWGSTALMSVAGPYEEVAPVYEEFRKGLGPLGLRLEEEDLRELRPVIAQLLQ